MNEKDRNIDRISKEKLTPKFEEKDSTLNDSFNLSPIFFGNSKNFILKEYFFSKRNKSQSENSNDETSSFSQKNSSNQQNNLVLS